MIIPLILSLFYLQFFKVLSVPVFSKGEGGYSCIKIPDILLTQQGSLLAFGEARMDSCSDYTWTDLVYKRSTDNGTSWSPLKVLYSNTTQDSYWQVIGNSAPVQDRVTKRIWVPFSRNNSCFWITFSDDDGMTWDCWTNPPRDLTPAIAGPETWNWVGSGPPSGIQLDSGRILIPAYHGPFHWDDGTVTIGFTYYSDDHGVTWYRGGDFGDFTDPLTWSGETQAVDLGNNRILVNSRSVTETRLLAYSNDGGLNFGEVISANGIWQPMDGCEGSTVKHRQSGLLFYSGVTPDPAITGYRFNLTLSVSYNDGLDWSFVKVIDSGPSAYSALTVLRNGSLAILYEKASDYNLIFIPDYQDFMVILEPTDIWSLTKLR